MTLKKLGAALLGFAAIVQFLLARELLFYSSFFQEARRLCGSDQLFDIRDNIAVKAVLGVAHSLNGNKNLAC